jgi:hypothetical protein
VFWLCDNDLDVIVGVGDLGDGITREDEEDAPPYHEGQERQELVDKGVVIVINQAEEDCWMSRVRMELKLLKGEIFWGRMSPCNDVVGLVNIVYCIFVYLCLFPFPTSFYFFTLASRWFFQTTSHIKYFHVLS